MILIAVVIVILAPGIVSSVLIHRSQSQELIFDDREDVDPTSEAYRTREKATMFDLPWNLPPMLLRAGFSPHSYREEFENMKVFNWEAWFMRAFFLAVLTMIVAARIQAQNKSPHATARG